MAVVDGVYNSLMYFLWGSSLWLHSWNYELLSFNVELRVWLVATMLNAPNMLTCRMTCWFLPDM